MRQTPFAHDVHSGGHAHSQPLVLSPSQFARPALHVWNVHLPAAQLTPPAWATRVVQFVVQLPHVSVVVSGSRHLLPQHVFVAPLHA